MYGIGLKKKFKAQHFLDFAEGEESDTHTHEYVVELEITRKDLEDENYVVDLVDLERYLGEIIGYYEGKLLNELPEFDDNPTIEVFAESIYKELEERIDDEMHSMKVKVWEADEDAYALYTEEGT